MNGDTNNPRGVSHPYLNFVSPSRLGSVRRNASCAHLRLTVKTARSSSRCTWKWLQRRSRTQVRTAPWLRAARCCARVQCIVCTFSDLCRLGNQPGLQIPGYQIPGREPITSCRMRSSRSAPSRTLPRNERPWSMAAVGLQEAAGRCCMATRSSAGVFRQRRTLLRGLGSRAVS